MRCSRGEMEMAGGYDGALQMFVEAPRDADVAHLRFLRWLVEHGRLERYACGPSPGWEVAESSARTSESARHAADGAAASMATR